MIEQISGLMLYVIVGVGCGGAVVAAIISRKNSKMLEGILRRQGAGENEIHSIKIGATK